MKIARVFTKSLLIATMSLPLIAGCTLDVTKTIAELRRPTVAFSTPTAWRCDVESQKIPTAHGIEPCTMCLNTQGPQVVTINKTAHEVPRQGQLAICETVAFTIAP